MSVPESCEELLRRMVEFDTVNSAISGRPDAEAPLAEYLAGVALEMGLTVTRLPIGGQSSNLLVTCPTVIGAPWLLFDSHLDTVSVEHMSIDPFAGDVRQGRLYGRGACDTKGSGAAMLWALNRYRQSDNCRNNVAVLFSLDEEIGKTGVTAFVGRQRDTLGWMPAGVICGEPTELRPVIAHNGVVRWTIRTHGVPAHSSDPSRGRSAISMMVRVVDALEGQYIPSLSASHALTGNAQCSVNMIRGGNQVNVIPEQCEIRIDRRVVPGEEADAVLPTVERLLVGLLETYPRLEFTQHDAFIDPPLDPAGHEPFIRFVQTVLADMSIPNDGIGVAYATNASTFSAAGVPAVVLGPGSIRQAHTSDEWIALDQLQRATELYYELMSRPWEGSV
ncbi:MAG: acetylornithine deacetylase [Phycisphaerae bacterium]